MIYNIRNAYVPFDKKLIKVGKSQLEDASADPKKVFSLLQSLMNRQDCSDVLPDLEDQEIADSLSNFFSRKD
jgi:hypothetical protein